MSEDNSLEQDIGKLSYLLNQIKEPIVCVKCSDEFMTGQTDAKSLQDYSRIDVGFTERGIQLWCQRHQINICHINFNGQKPEVDLDAWRRRKLNEIYFLGSRNINVECCLWINNTSSRNLY